MSVPRRGLGSKGLGMEALINSQLTDLSEKGKTGPFEVDINKIEPNRQQPRKKFEEEGLEELASSIREYGIVQPIIVRKEGDSYSIIAGERRWRAAKIAGLTKMPVIIKKMGEKEAFEIALIENIQREDLNAIEEAESYQKLSETCHLNQEEIAAKLGKSRSAIANSLRLIHLDERVKEFVISGKLTGGHARALLSVENGDLQYELAEKVIEEELNVRQTETLVKRINTQDNIVEEKTEEKQNGVYRFIENELKSIFGTKVKVSKKRNKGKIEIEYYSDEDLDRIMGIMKQTVQ
ncbi:MAG: ParB/RepB/Spo0J family partition protein [Clostridiales bacterium]|nr:ParB/RepB/Spo0J family partition protein [Clostridiales bacterium]